jgi:S1-C subfamily serine protease
MPAGVQAITREMAEQLGGTDLSGVRVTQIFTDMTALPAGLQVGDLILAVDGEKIPATKAGDEEVFEAMIREYPVDAKPTLTVLRGREKLMITVPLQRTPKMEREMKKYRDENFEFTARDLSFFDKAREGWSGDVAGVLVTEVRDGGSAALAGLTFNDLIESVNDSPVKDVTSLRTKLKELADESPKFVVLQVLRGVHTRFLELETGWTRKITEKNER